MSYPQGTTPYGQAHENGATNGHAYPPTPSVYPSLPTGQELRFLLLGKTGSGKSTSGNTVLGAPMFTVGMTFESVTWNCELRRNTNLGRNIEMMDSPGLFDTKRSHEDIAIDIVKAVAGMHPGPHAILYVIPLGRYTDEEYAVYTRLKALFDQQLTKYLVVLFTGGDRLGPGQSVETMLQHIPPGLAKVLEECGGRYVLFNNHAADPRPQVEQLFSIVGSMNQANGGQPYTCPKYDAVGQGLEEEVQRRMAEVEQRELERTKYVQQLHHEAQQAQQDMVKERENFQQREDERAAQAQREEERREREMGELKARLEQQQASMETQREEERKLRLQLEQERRQQLKEMEEQRQREREELLERERRMEEMLAREREESRRLQEERDRQHQQQMQELKNSISRGEEPGFLGQLIGGVVSVVKRIPLIGKLF